ncbi:MAG: hypothetical protein ACYC7A_15180 [Thermoanaerobaculia bacterium]
MSEYFRPSHRTGGVSLRNWLPALVAAAAITVFVPSLRADVPIGASWASAAPAIDGTVVAGEWAAATATPLAHGTMLTMNDGTSLYVMLDVVDDTAAQPPGPGSSGDWYALPFDIDLNHAVTPNVDKAFAPCQDGRIFIRSFYLSPGVFTTCQDVPPPTVAAIGFGATPNSATPHRFWEFRFSFDEIGVDPSTWSVSSGTPPRVRFNVATHSQSPAFGSAQPDPNTYPTTLANLFALDLAMTPMFPPGTTGPVFAGVGLVPSTYIDANGYANINIPGYYAATAAPFGGNLNVFGHWATLETTPGVKKYRVLYSHNGGPWTRLLQTWTNFKWNGTTWVPMVVGPDADEAYRIPASSEIWYLTNLLIGWQSAAFANGEYELRLELLNNGGGVLPSPAGNSLTLFIVNVPPTVTINSIRYNGAPICSCSIVTQGDAPAGFTFNVSVTDTYGALSGYSLYGIYGTNQSTGSIAGDSYAAHVDEDGLHQWDGVSAIDVPAVPWRASSTCAYSFILSASSRTQNGYGRLFPNVNYHMSLTVLLGSGPGSILGCP